MGLASSNLDGNTQRNELVSGQMKSNTSKERNNKVSKRVCGCVQFS